MQLSTQRKIKGINFSEVIENNRKFKDLILLCFNSQSENKYPIEFISAIALHEKRIVKNDGEYYIKDYMYKGTLTQFEFLSNKYFLEAIKLTDRPKISNFKF
jgi:hypothetical protein